MLKITVIMAIVFTLTGCDSESSEPRENREAVLGSGDTSEQVSEPIERSEDSVMSVQLEKIERRSPLDEHDSDSAESEDSLNESEEIAEGDQGQMDRQEPEEENVAPKRMESSDEPEMPNAGTHVFYDKNAPYKPTKSRLVRLTKAQIINDINSVLKSNIPLDALGKDPVIGSFRNNADSLAIDTQKSVNDILEVINQAMPQWSKRAEFSRFVQCPTVNGIVCTAEDCKCLTDYFKRTMEKTYRRPVTSKEVKFYTDLNNDIRINAKTSHIKAFQWALTALLSSPEFLFRTEGAQGAEEPVAQLNAAETLAFASYTASNKSPARDDVAKAQAIVGNQDRFQDYVRRQLRSADGKRVLKTFLTQWFNVEEVESVEKNKGVFPGFNQTLKNSMAKEIDGFLDLLLGKDKLRISEVITSDQTVLDQTMANFYGLTAAGKTDMAAERKGLLTTAGFIAMNSSDASTLPTRRGSMILSNLLCVMVPGVPAGIALPPLDREVPKTTRQRFEDIANSGASCKSCHMTLDPLGFGLESFDAVGAYREMENNLPVKTASRLGVLPASGPIEFDDSVSMVEILGQSPELKACAVKRAFEFVYGRKAKPSDDGILASAHSFYEKGEWDIKELFVALITDERYRKRTSEGGASGDPMDPMEGGNQITFTNTIRDQMAGCLGCHGPNRAPNWGNYNTIKDYPFQGRFTRGHNGVLWTPEQKATLQQWVEAGRPQ